MSDGENGTNVGSTAGETVLVLHQGIGEADYGQSCLPHFAVEDPSRLALVRVSYTTPDEPFLDAFEAHAGGRPAATSLIRARGREGSAMTTSDRADVRIWTVNPNDLTGLTMRLRDALDESVTAETQPVFCFDSITALLQYTDLESAYKFLHLLTGQLRDVGALAHFHLQRGAHDDQDVHTLQGLFDRVAVVDTET